MSDMFYTYDNVIEKPLVKAGAENLIPGIEQPLKIDWLRNIKGQILGIKAAAGIAFSLYLSLEIANDSEEAEEYLNSHLFYIEFLDKAYETVLKKQAIKYYTGILQIEVEAGELNSDVYYIRLYSIDNPDYNTNNTGDSGSDGDLDSDDGDSNDSDNGDDGDTTTTVTKYRFPDGHPDYYWWYCHHDWYDTVEVTVDSSTGDSDSSDTDSETSTDSIEYTLISPNSNFILVIM